MWYERREQVGAFRGPYTLPLLFRLLQIGNGHGSPERAWLLRPVWRLTTIRRGYCRSNFHRFLLFGRHSCKMILPHRCLHPPLDPTDHNIKVFSDTNGLQIVSEVRLGAHCTLPPRRYAQRRTERRRQNHSKDSQASALQLPDGFDKPSGEEKWQVMAQSQEMKQMSLQAYVEDEITTVVAYAVMEGNFPLTI